MYLGFKRIKNVHTMDEACRTEFKIAISKFKNKNSKDINDSHMIIIREAVVEVFKSIIRHLGDKRLPCQTDVSCKLPCGCMFILTQKETTENFGFGFFITESITFNFCSLMLK